MNKKYLVFIGAGFELVGLVVVAIYIAQIFEEKIQSKGLITLAAVFLAFAGWLLHVIYIRKNIEKNDKN